MSETKIEKWDVLQRDQMDDYRIFTVHKQRCRSPLGKQGDFFVLDCPDWINVIPLTDKNEVVLIEQYRHGSNEVTLEIPGGCVDPTDKNPMETARRELQEETGYVSDDWKEIGVNEPNPAFIHNHCYSYVARNVIQKHKQNLDPMEEIGVKLVPLEEIPGLIRSGKIQHSLVITAFYFHSIGR